MILIQSTKKPTSINLEPIKDEAAEVLGLSLAGSNISATDNSTGILGLFISGEGIRLHVDRGVIFVGT